MLPVISTAILALRQQQAELDEDIATVLRLHVGNPLGVEIERMEAVLQELLPPHQPRAEGTPGEEGMPWR